uniref:Uncharacterized protein n=1 Tax=Picea glauca TaxID=3330 RepID=A0A101M3V8_PICGL|nr:hypothetical protein ABT39_MTgene358 [Picea glauca]QHR86506.1 hypothetical protein Q903MT_gene508 [Picea sitchensis]
MVPLVFNWFYAYCIGMNAVMHRMGAREEGRCCEPWKRTWMGILWLGLDLINGNGHLNSIFRAITR